MNHPKVFYFTNIAPHYREEIWRLLSEEESWDFHFVFGDNYAKSEIKSINLNQDWIRSRYTKVGNVSFRGVLLWQLGALSIAFSKNMGAAVLLGDMHIITNWLLAIILRLKGTRVYFWGHGFTGNEDHFKKKVRLIFNRLAHGHFLYGNRSRDIMKGLGFQTDILHVVNNSLFYSLQKELRDKIDSDKIIDFFEDNSLPMLVFIGRLSQVKRIDILLDALDSLNSNGPMFNLLIIGNGSERKFLESKVFKEKNQGQVYFFGPSYTEKTNAWLLSKADLCISPGNIGLTAIHCMTYGTPCATHDDFSDQMPEFEAIKEGITGFFYQKDNVDDLVQKVVNWFDENREKREMIRRNCFQIIDECYNPEFQMSKFKNTILGYENSSN